MKWFKIRGAFSVCAGKHGSVNVNLGGSVNIIALGLSFPSAN